MFVHIGIFLNLGIRVVDLILCVLCGVCTVLLRLLIPSRLYHVHLPKTPN